MGGVELERSLHRVLQTPGRGAARRLADFPPNRRRAGPPRLPLKAVRGTVAVIMAKLRIVLAWIAADIFGSLLTIAVFDAPLFRGFVHAEYRGAIVRYSLMAIALFWIIGAFQVTILCGIDALMRRSNRALRATVVVTIAVLYAVVVPMVALLTFVHAMLAAVPFFAVTGLLCGLWLTLTPE